MVEIGRGLVGVADGDQIDVALLDEAGVGSRVFVDADSQNDQVGIGAVELEQRRQLGHAGATPSGPEIEQNDLAAVVGQMDGCEAVGDFEVGGGLAGLCGACTAVAAGDHGQHQERGEGEEAKKTHLSIIRSGAVDGKGRGVSDEHQEKAAGWKPVLGLTDEQPVVPAARAAVYDQPEPAELMELTVIVPARNEEDCIGTCLESLTAQSDEAFKLGRDWELVVVNDGSTDRTAEIARGFAGVTVMNAQKLEPGWTGKCNAVWTAARRARGKWLLFTDADTIHQPGNLHRAMHEAAKNHLGMLSYSAKQLTTSWVQRLLMPLIFSELTMTFPYEKVSDPKERVAAANGQFLMVEREAYRKIGGHKSVSDRVLEDVELAMLAKKRKVGLRLRYAEEELSTRMYRSNGAMMEGWTKNLALLFPSTLAMVFWRALDFFLLFGLPFLAVEMWSARLSSRSFTWLGVGWILLLIWGRNLFRYYARVSKSNFGFVDCALSPLGLPLFVWLLYRSWFQNKVLKRVTWKGREYAG